MILEHIDHIHRHAGLNPLFEEAFSFLASRPILTPGRHDVGSNGLFLFASEGEAPGGTRMEAHRHHLDLHFTLEGTDHFGWRPLSLCGKPDAPFNEEQDVWHFADPPSVIIPNHAGQVIIVWPEDVHAPLISASTFRKLVIKVPMVSL